MFAKHSCKGIIIGTLLTSNNLKVKYVIHVLYCSNIIEFVYPRLPCDFIFNSYLLKL